MHDSVCKRCGSSVIQLNNKPKTDNDLGLEIHNQHTRTQLSLKSPKCFPADEFFIYVFVLAERLHDKVYV